MSFISLGDLYGNMQQEMLYKLDTGRSAFVHKGTIGNSTEANWIKWFDTYLPKRYKAGKGIVIDSSGTQSQQIDVIIYDVQYSYLVFRCEDQLLIPAESVYAVFEVKQDLKKEHLEYAGNKAKSVRELYRTSAPIKHAGGEYAAKPLHEIVAGILTTHSEWKKEIPSHVIENIYEQDRIQRLDLVCSVSNNTFSINNNIFCNEYNDTIKPSIELCNEKDSLVFLLLKLLQKLQNIGTVPAIDFASYAKHIESSYYNQT